MLEGPTLPHFLVLECFLGRDHLPGARVPVTLEMARRNAFNLTFGPVDAAGLLKVSRSQLLERAHQALSLGPAKTPDVAANEQHLNIRDVGPDLESAETLVRHDGIIQAGRNHGIHFVTERWSCLRSCVLKPGSASGYDV